MSSRRLQDVFKTNKCLLGKWANFHTSAGYLCNEEFFELFLLYAFFLKKLVSKIGLLKKFIKFLGKQLCWSHKSFQVSSTYFPANFVRFLSTPFLQNTFGRMLLFFRVFFHHSHTFHKCNQRYLKALLDIFLHWDNANIP